MKPRTCVAVTIGCALALALPLLAQTGKGARGMMWHGGGGWGPGTPYARMFDPKTIETVSGAIVSVDQMTPMAGMGAGVHLTLKTPQGNLSVHLGPVWYLENQDVSVSPGDQIQVRGSRITFQGKPAIIAVELTKGQETLRLRDEEGFPLWSAWRQRAG
jgi:hypothetical protein